MPLSDGVSQVALADPHFAQRLKLGLNGKIYVEARILHTQVYFSPIEDQPPASPVFDKQLMDTRLIP